MLIKASKKFKVRNIFWSAFLTVVFLIGTISSMTFMSFKIILWLFCLILTTISLVKTIKMVNKCQIELNDDMIVIEQIAKKYRKSNFIERFCQPYIYTYDAQRNVRDYVIILKREEILYKDIIKCDFISKLRVRIEQARSCDLGIITDKKSYISNFQFNKKDLELIRYKIHEKMNDNIVEK